MGLHHSLYSSRTSLLCATVFILATGFWIYHFQYFPFPSLPVKSTSSFGSHLNNHFLRDLLDLPYILDNIKYTLCSYSNMLFSFITFIMVVVFLLIVWLFDYYLSSTLDTCSPKARNSISNRENRERWGLKVKQGLYIKTWRLG